MPRGVDIRTLEFEMPETIFLRDNRFSGSNSNRNYAAARRGSKAPFFLAGDSGGPRMMKWN